MLTYNLDLIFIASKASDKYLQWKQICHIRFQIWVIDIWWTAWWSLRVEQLYRFLTWTNEGDTAAVVNIIDLDQVWEWDKENEDNSYQGVAHRKFIHVSIWVCDEYPISQTKDWPVFKLFKEGPFVPNCLYIIDLFIKHFRIAQLFSKLFLHRRLPLDYSLFIRNQIIVCTFDESLVHINKLI